MLNFLKRGLLAVNSKVAALTLGVVTLFGFGTHAHAQIVPATVDITETIDIAEMITTVGLYGAGILAAVLGLVAVFILAKKAYRAILAKM